MNHELIRSKLQAVLGAVGETARTDDRQLALILHEPKRGHPSVGQLLEALRADPSLAIFDGKMQMIGNLGTLMEFSNLAHWLIRRGREVGSAQAVADLQRYVGATEIPFSMTFGLTGLKIDRRCDLGFGIVLLPWDNLPNSNIKRTLDTQVHSSFRSKWPSAAVVQEQILLKLHASGEEHRLSPLDESEMRDALLCIGAMGPFAPEILVSWLDPPPWAPVICTHFSMPHLEGLPRHDLWTDEHCGKASKLFETFKALSAERKDALRLPSQRLSMAMRRVSNADSAIDLGIALEALFLNDQQGDRGELTFRLQLRAARHLKQNIKERRAVFQLVGQLYRLRSTAVHTGRSPSHIEGRTTSDLLEEGFRLTADAIRRHVDEGMPDWHNVQLS